MLNYRWVAFLVLVLVLPAIHPPGTAQAACVVESSGTYSEGANLRDDKCDVNGAKWQSLKTQIAGENIPADVMKVRTEMTSSGQKTGDAQIKATPGYVSHMICQGTDAASVAGTIIVYDSLTETGTALFTFTVAALDYHVPMVFPIQTVAATGIYLGYATTSDVNCTVFYQ